MSEEADFAGFRRLDANFTTTPNQFFDEVLGRYPLRVVTVVGILIRETLGWKDRITGEKRVEVELTLPQFVRPELSLNSARQGLCEAIIAGFVVRTADHTNRDGGRYALRWFDTDAQREAIERHRRAVGDTRPISDGASREPLNIGPPISGPPISGPPNIGGPIFGGHTKKGYKYKDSFIDISKNKTLNVERVIYRPKEEDSPKRDLITAVRDVIELTADSRSVGRFIQLCEICEDNGCQDAWNDAVQATVKAKEAGRLKGKAGAYFNGTMGRILAKRNVYVPTGTPEERTDLQAEIANSLAAGAAG